MGWFGRFATQGLYFPALMIAFGSLVVLRAPFQQRLSTQQIQAAPPWARWLLRINSPRLHQRCGWAIIGLAIIIAVVRIARRA
jgi:hypothetical protein